MKVLVFTPQIHLLGGAEKLALELVKGLNAQPGIQADLLVMGPENVLGTAEAKRYLLNNGVRSVRFLGRMPNTQGRSMIRFMLKLRHILQTYDYDFVETSQVGPSILACWATLGLRTYHVVGIHEIFIRKHQKSWSFTFLRFSFHVNRSTQFYAISEVAMQHWIDYAHINPGRIRVIYNSIASEHFDNHKTRQQVQNIPHIDGNDYKALFVGRLCKRKGLDTLIDALGPILYSEKIHLLIVGWQGPAPDAFYPGDENLLEKLLLQIHNNGWEDRIHFLGIRDDISNLINFVDVLIHPARDEGFGLVLAEALAAGLPVIATNVGGIPEVLANTDSILVPSDDPIALRNALLEVNNRTPVETSNCIRKARERAELFRPERRITDMLNYFQDLSISSKPWL